ETTWTAEQKSTFVRVCGPAMEQFGYTLEGQLFTEAVKRPIYLYAPVAGTTNENVHVQNLMNDGFNRFGRGFLLHPNWPGKPAPEVRYKSLEFFGHNHFSAYLFLKNELSEPVEYRLRIESPEDASIIFEETTEVPAGKGKQWDVSLPNGLAGKYDVVVSTAMGAEAQTNHKAWAMWKEPHFSNQPEQEQATP
ncbi:MAG TPA: hypothetical protein VKP65_22510, partial [Rhodothermales bacterium]|nr:hypothetical protein [Rhodothermales bacterium]